MAKPKINAKDFLLQKGEYLALGVAGVGLLVLLVWGAMTWSSAKPPEESIKKSTAAANAVYQAMQAPEVPADERAKLDQDLKLSKWNGLRDQNGYPVVPPEEFAIAGPYFDPIGRPDTKWELPQVLGVREFQVDLVRAPMKGYDLVFDKDGKAQVAVLSSRVSKDKLDDDKIKAAKEALRRKGNQGGKQYAQSQQVPQPPAFPAGPGMPGPGMPGPGMPGPGVAPPGLAMPGPGGAGFGFGNPGFDQGATRTETTVKYVPLENLDTEIDNGHLPAMTVIPLRMVVVNASFPLKEQEDALRRALRLPPNVDVSGGIKFDGFNVKRKVISPSGRVVTTPSVFVDETGKEVREVPDKDGWVKYNYEGKYVELIYSRKLGDYFDFDATKDPDSVYLPYFVDRSYAEAMALPFPELVPELGKYPKLRLPSIQENIERLKKANTPKQTPSELRNRIEGRKPGSGLYTPQSSSQTGGAAVPGYNPSVAMPGPGSSSSSSGTGGRPALTGPGAPGQFNPLGPRGSGTGAAATGPMGAAGEAEQVTIDHLLVRFVDCDVRPGYTYQYQLQVRMENPVHGKQFEDRLANRTQATDPALKVLTGPWVQLGESLTVPNESFLYAIDPAEYNKKVETAYPVVLPQTDENKEQNAINRKIQDKLKARENQGKQAAVQVLTWMEQVRTESGAAREPVGTWVVAEMPVGKGEYVGRKVYVKLPLWSSTQSAYMFREIAAVVPKDKGPAAKALPAVPQGWLIDFTADKSVLVDFEGGKIKTPYGPRGTASVEDEVASELLIVQTDGKLVVRNSAVDAEDKIRKEYTAVWQNWLAEVAKVKAAGTGTGVPGFGRPEQKP